MLAPFHLSFPVSDLGHTRGFYSGVLGCKEGKSMPTHVDFAFFGHQITCHLSPERVRPAAQFGLDGNHFGAIITTDEFVQLERRLRSAGVAFLKAPETQNAGTPSERRKMIFADPSGNAIEMKCYADQASIFA
jgi:extradiol dioxygenase family protein